MCVLHISREPLTWLTSHLVGVLKTLDKQTALSWVGQRHVPCSATFWTSKQHLRSCIFNCGVFISSFVPAAGLCTQSSEDCWCDSYKVHTTKHHGDWPEKNPHWFSSAIKAAEVKRSVIMQPVAYRWVSFDFLMVYIILSCIQCASKMCLYFLPQVSWSYSGWCSCNPVPW